MRILRKLVACWSGPPFRSDVVPGEGGGGMEGFFVGDRVRGAVNIFLKVYKMKFVLLVHAHIVFRILAFLVQEKNKFIFLLASLEH
jgi:hypothetical protein